MTLHGGVPHEVLASLLQEEVVSILYLVVDWQEDGKRHWALTVSQLPAAQICKNTKKALDLLKDSSNRQ